MKNLSEALFTNQTLNSHSHKQLFVYSRVMGVLQKLIFTALAASFLYLTWSQNLQHPSIKPLLSGQVRDPKEFFSRFVSGFAQFFLDALSGSTLSRLSSISTLSMVVTLSLLFSASKFQVLFIQAAYLGAAAFAFPLFLIFWEPNSLRTSSRQTSSSLTAWLLVIGVGSISHFLVHERSSPHWTLLLWISYAAFPWLHSLFTRAVGSSLYAFVAGSALISVTQSLPDLVDLASIRSWNTLVSETFVNHAAASLVFDHIGITLTSIFFVLFDGPSPRKPFFVLAIAVFPAIFFPLYLISRPEHHAKSH